MSIFDWESFLKRWSQETVEAIASDQNKLPPSVIKSGWLGYPGATEQQIAEAEARLNITLPPSYKAFLKVTNGWRQTTPFINKVWSAQKIEWFSVKNQKWIDAFLEKSGHLPAESSNSSSSPPSISDEEYFVYGEKQDCSKLRCEYLQTALEISKRGEGAIYLLNPQVVTPDGEWEAWFFGDWLPGADRYHSFQEMMQAEYENFLELREMPDSSSVAITSALKSLEPELAQMSVVPSSIPTTDLEADKAWNKFASFTIELQTRKGEGYSEQQAILHNVETDTMEAFPTIDAGAIQQWILKQMGDSLKDNLIQAHTEETVGLEISQLRVIQLPCIAKPGTQMIADNAHPLFPDAIQKDEPFMLEVSIKVVGDTASFAERQFVCRAQCVAYNLATKLNIDLGDITTHISDDDQVAHVALFPEMILQQPGIYRLKVWVTLQNSSALPSYFKVPMLQVV
jgi:SMI1 / KNR4 family (SUKH-1)